MGKSKQIDLHEVYNDQCKVKCNPKERKEFTDDGMCNELGSAVDSLPVRCVGEWAYQKIYWLNKYFGIFANGMKDKWDALQYVEIGSGPGRVILRENGKEIDGTPMTVLKHKAAQHFDKAIFFDRSEKALNALDQRIAAIRKNHISKLIVGDYSSLSDLQKLSQESMDRSLTLALIDPTDCSFPFNSLATLKKSIKNMDILLNVAIGTDLSRNIRQAILDDGYEKARDKYSSFLGSPNFFFDNEVHEAAKVKDYKKLRRKLTDYYRKSLEEIGYDYVRVVPVEHYYYMLFASSSKKGAEFWEKVNTITPDKQRTLLF